MNPAPDLIAPVTLAVLAGGRGSRMGAAKDRLSIQGVPILRHLLNRAAGGGPTMLVASPAHPCPIGHELFDQVVLDAEPGLGPLGGIAAALAAATTVGVCLLSVDMPGVTSGQVRWLADALDGRAGAYGLLCRRHHDARPVLEPFPCIVRTTAGPLVAAHLAAGGRAMRSLLDLPGFAAVDAPPDWPVTTWLNLNAPADLAATGAKIL